MFDKDVAVTLRDGVTIYVDLLRPVGTEMEWTGTDGAPRHPVLEGGMA